MFLKSFKEKSNQKFINKIVDARHPTQSLNKVGSVGIILNLSEYDDFESFRALFDDLKLNPNKVKFAAYTDDPQDVDLSKELLFSRKEIGWNGKIKCNTLESFINTKFDALISYYKDDNLELNLVTALSQANFKIGISIKDKRLNDLILDIKPKDYSLFKLELVKYLTILNKL